MARRAPRAAEGQRSHQALPPRLAGSIVAHPRQRRAGELGDALQEVGGHAGLVALAVGRGQDQQAERRTGGAGAQRDQRQRGGGLGMKKLMYFYM